MSSSSSRGRGPGHNWVFWNLAHIFHPVPHGALGFCTIHTRSVDKLANFKCRIKSSLFQSAVAVHVWHIYCILFTVTARIVSLYTGLQLKCQDKRGLSGPAMPKSQDHYRRWKHLKSGQARSVGLVRQHQGPTTILKVQGRSLRVERKKIYCTPVLMAVNMARQHR